MRQMYLSNVSHSPDAAAGDGTDFTDTAVEEHLRCRRQRRARREDVVDEDDAL